jgi:hypothetical protein
MPHELGNKILIKFPLQYKTFLVQHKFNVGVFSGVLPVYLSVGNIKGAHHELMSLTFTLRYLVTTIILNHPVALGLVVYLRACRIVTKLKYST